MDACSRASPFLFALLLQTARVGSAEGAAPQELTHRVGDSATFSLEVPKGVNFSNLVWRSSSRGPMHVVAAWEPGNIVDVLSTSYARRVTFHEKSWSLEIHNLTKADGGFYKVVELKDPDETVLKEYILVVFDIRVEVSKSANGNCSLHLWCEAGAGASNKLTYRWSPGGPDNQALHLTLHPADKDKRYTCTATTRDTQRSVTVTPYQHCPESSVAAGRPSPAALGPALLALLVLRRLLL